MREYRHRGVPPAIFAFSIAILSHQIFGVLDADRDVKVRSRAA